MTEQIADKEDKDKKKKLFSLPRLLKAGVHFGHHPRRWNPKMKKYIYDVRNDAHVINLDKTIVLLQEAMQAISNIISLGGSVLLVGTRKETAKFVSEAAKATAQYYIDHHWLGGTITNWETVSNSIIRLQRLDKKLSDPLFIKSITKKEMLSMQRQRDKLERDLGGIRDMGGIPDMVFILDTNREYLAIKEAKCMDIPIIAILDTNSDPDGIAYPIPGNDDSIKSIEYYCNLYIEAAFRGLEEQMNSMTIDYDRADNNENLSDDLIESN